MFDVVDMKGNKYITTILILLCCIVAYISDEGLLSLIINSRGDQKGLSHSILMA